MPKVSEAATQEERLSMLTGWWGGVTADGSRSDKEIGAVPRLSGRGRDRAAARDALVRRKGGAVLDRIRQQVKGVLCVRLDQLELRKGVLVGFDVVTILHLIETVRRAQQLAIAVVSAPLLMPCRQGGGYGTRIGAGVQVDRQQRVQRPGHRDQRLSDVAGRRDRGKLGSDIRGRKPVDVAIGSRARYVGVVVRIEPLLPLA